MLRSLKWQVGVGAFVVLAAAIVVMGGLTYWWVERQLVQQLEDSLRLTARAAASHVSLERGFLELYHENLARIEAGDKLVALQVLNRRGGIVFGPGIEYPEINYNESPTAGERLFTAEWEGVPARWLELTFAPTDEYAIPGEPPADYRARLVVARSRVDLLATLAELRRAIGVAAIGGALGGAVLLVAMAVFATRPIDRLARAIRRLDHDRMGPHIKVAGLPSELRPVVAEVNTLMERLRLAFDRERTFSSNVAHELRTPLTGLRSTLEVVLSAPPSAETSQQAQETCLEIVRQTQVLVEKLLRLTRLQSGLAESDLNAVELGELVEQSWSSFANLAEERGLQVTLSLPPGIVARVNEDFLLVVLNNLLENAANYCPEGGDVRVSVEDLRSASGPRVRVSNTVQDLDKSEVNRMFDAFWRKDVSRSATGVHAGLGLSISRAMARQLGARLSAELSSAESPKLVFTLQMRRDQMTANQSKVL